METSKFVRSRGVGRVSRVPLSRGSHRLPPSPRSRRSSDALNGCALAIGSTIYGGRAPTIVVALLVGAQGAFLSFKGYAPPSARCAELRWAARHGDLACADCRIGTMASVDFFASD
jgi:hypothetical protein